MSHKPNCSLQREHHAYGYDTTPWPFFFFDPDGHYSWFFPRKIGVRHWVYFAKAKGDVGVCIHCSQLRLIEYIEWLWYFMIVNGTHVEWKYLFSGACHIIQPDRTRCALDAVHPKISQVSAGETSTYLASHWWFQIHAEKLLIIYMYLHYVCKYVWYAIYVELYMYIDMCACG